MSYLKNCPHQWTQPSPFIPTWVREMPPPKVCPQPPITPNPVFLNTATLQICSPLKLEKSGPNSLLITVSIPAESSISLPTKALEIKTIKKSFSITQNQFINCVPTPAGIVHDTPKLFLTGLVRKDIQYSEVIQQTPTTVAGVMRDFVVNIPISCVIDLGRNFMFPPTYYNHQREYGLSQSKSSCSGEISMNQKLSSSEFNLTSGQFFNLAPTCQLLYSQINEVDHATDPVPLQGGPAEEYTFTILQEKMAILIQIKLTFPSPVDYYDPDCSHDKNRKHCDTNTHCNCNIESRTLFERITTLFSRLSCIIKRPRYAAFL